MTLPEYFRTQEELTKPFMSDESPVRKAGLTLVSVEIKEFPLPEKKLLLETGDAKITARFMTEQTRAWSNSMFLSSKSNVKLDIRSILVLLENSRLKLKVISANRKERLKKTCRKTSFQYKSVAQSKEVSMFKISMQWVRKLWPCFTPCCDWLPEWARWSYLTSLSGLPAVSRKKIVFFLPIQWILSWPARVLFQVITAILTSGFVSM